jgi:hypothetical protein
MQSLPWLLAGNFKGKVEGELGAVEGDDELTEVGVEEEESDDDR